MQQSLAAVRAKFTAWTGQAPAFCVRAPGRINIIGEHTDYNDGLVLPGAIDKALFYAVRPNGTQSLRVHALDIGAYGEADLATIQPTDQLWLNYLLGIGEQFQQLGQQLAGLDIVFGGNLPIGAGVSSSAALECGMATIWNHVLRTQLDGKALAQLAQRSSHQFIGIPCGIMDQFASLNGQAGQAILLDCLSLDYRAVPVAVAGCSWVLLNTRVSHNLADSEYPLRVRECREGVRLLNAHFGHINSLRDATPPQVEALKDHLPTKVYKRCRYVVGEHERTLLMLEALAAGDAAQVGKLLNLTHLGLALDYEVSCPEIETFFRFALQHPAAYGARLMGGGFGGCTLNLVQAASVDTFIEAALAHYQKEHQREGDALTVVLTDGARVVKG
ncbi:MAG: galactokinase [Bacteroidota bacterium]